MKNLSQLSLQHFLAIRNQQAPLGDSGRERRTGTGAAHDGGCSDTRFALHRRR